MNKYWFILNGKPRSGKGTFVEYMNKYVPVKSVSTVDVIKKVCKELGWNGEKDDNGRAALSDFKDLSTKYFDHPFEYVRNELDKFKNSDDVIFTVDVREPKDIHRLVDECGFKSVFISNKNITHIPNNHADMEVENYDYDYVIHNDGTLEDFDLEVKDFLINLGLIEY
jgi:hypothetical protein